MHSLRLSSNLRTLVLGLGLLAAGPIAAEEPRDDRPWYDLAHAGLSDWLVGTAAGLDSFFGDPRAIEEDYTNTYVRLQLGLTQSRIEGTEWNTRAYAKVPLPKISRRLKVFVSGGDEDESVAASPEESLTRTRESSTVGAQYVLEETARGRWSVTGSIDPNVKLRYRYLKPWGGGWYTRYTQNLYWDEDKDTGIQVRGDLERVISPTMLYRLTTDVDWWDGETGVNWLVGSALLHRINDRNAIAYDISVNGVSKPDWESTYYRTGVRFRRNFFRSWLFYEVEPALRWSQDPLVETDSMTFDPAITVRLEIQFGKIRGL